MSGLILDNALKKGGLGINDVKLSSPLVGPDALNALANGAVSPAWVSAPLEVEAAKNPDLVPIAGYAPGVTGTAVMAGRTLLDRPEVAVKFTQVLSKVTKEHRQGDYRKNPETVRLLAAAEEVDASTIENSALLAFDPSFERPAPGRCPRGRARRHRTRPARRHAARVPRRGRRTDRTTR
ncbi:hypothetical protein AB0L25_14930 [Spirillospora sp. NPDC052242]